MGILLVASTFALYEGQVITQAQVNNANINIMDLQPECSGAYKEIRSDIVMVSRICRYYNLKRECIEINNTNECQETGNYIVKRYYFNLYGRWSYWNDVIDGYGLAYARQAYSRWTVTKVKKELSYVVEGINKLKTVSTSNIDNFMSNTNMTSNDFS